MITTREETVTTSDSGTFSAHLSVPGSGAGPGILLLQEIFGVNDFLTGKALDLATLGYVVMCPDVFWRVEPNVSLTHDGAALQQAYGLVGRYSSEVPDETKIGDLSAALAQLKALPEVTGRTAVLGYCLGGYLAYRLAAASDPDACVSYYGSNVEQFLAEADQITCPILFHYGGQDPFIPASSIEQVREVFGPRDDASIEIQPDAGHAFENLLAPAFGNPEAAKRSWPVTVAWLGEQLGEPVA